MPRFLSPEWFDAAVADPAEAAGPTADRLVIQQTVTDTPDGDVSYLVVVEGDSARLARAGGSDTPDLTITTGWATAAAVAQGQLSAQRALMDGHLRVRGDLNRLAAATERLKGLDPLPAELRESTTY